MMTISNIAKMSMMTAEAATPSRIIANSITVNNSTVNNSIVNIVVVLLSQLLVLSQKSKLVGEAY